MWAMTSQTPTMGSPRGDPDISPSKIDSNDDVLREEFAQSPAP
jgi:hypothetical protein